MERQDFNRKIEQAAKAIFSYCTARTPNQFEAEDLAQDILVALYTSAHTLREEKAFYGFLWGVAGNVYKNWCKNQAKRRECVLSDHLSEPDHWPEEDRSDLYLLRRELTLLSAKYRKAVVLYYVENKSCREIALSLSVSESMVKYLLFKSRQILKEGLTMERNYGTQSYNPKELSLLFWGNGANRYYHLCDSKISQNILFTCYNDKLTHEQISLEIGVSLPYMEDKLSELLEYDLLKKEGNRYTTNVVIFTQDLSAEITAKTADLQKQIAKLVQQSISLKEPEVRALGFTGADMNEQTYLWQMTCFLLYQAVIVGLSNRIQLSFPKDKFGTECYVWGSEKGQHDYWKSQFGFGISNVCNEVGDYIQFMDIPINGEMVHHYCFNRQTVTNVFLDIAKGSTAHFSENDKAMAADMVRKGYVLNTPTGFEVNAPVFTRAQHNALTELFADVAAEIANEAEALMEAVTKILKNHIPVHLKHLARPMAYLRLFEDAISAPVSILCEQKLLLPYHGEGMLPTTYVILN